MQFILEENGISFKPIIAVSPSHDVNEEKLKAMLYSFDITNYPVPLLALSEKGMLAYLSKIWDCPAVFLDNSFSDETAKIEEPLRTLIKISSGDYGETNTGRNIIAVISHNAGYIAHRLSPESVIPLSLAGVTLDYSNDYIRNVTSDMESLVNETIISNINDVCLLVPNMVEDFKPDKNQYQTDEAYHVSISLMAAVCFLRRLFNINFATSEELNQLINDINSQRNALVDSDTAILRDFAKIASDKFRAGSFTAVRKKNVMIMISDELFEKFEDSGDVRRVTNSGFEEEVEKDYVVYDLYENDKVETCEYYGRAVFTKVCGIWMMKSFDSQMFNYNKQGEGKVELIISLI